MPYTHPVPDTHDRSSLSPQSSPPPETGSGWNPQAMVIGLMVPFMTIILNMTMFAVALPSVRRTFDIQADVTTWLDTAYMLTFITFMPLYGRLGDGLGKRRLFMVGVAILVAGTAITLAAFNLPLLIVGRVIQGMGAGAVSPLAIALISDYYPPAGRGRALGTWNSVGPATAIVGPFLAGFMVDHLGWRTIFAPVLLIGLIALFVVKTQVPGTGRQFVRPGFLRSFDWPGVVLFGTAIATLLFYLSSRPITGVAPLRDWRLLLLTTILFGSFILWERRQETPFVPLNIYAYKNFRLASLGSGIRMFTMSSIGVMMSLYLADVRSLDATAIGMMLMLHAGSLLITMRAGGLLADRWGSRWLVVGGMVAQTAAMIYFAMLPATVPLGLLIGGLVTHGLGAGIYLAPLHRTAMSRVEQNQTGVAAGMYSMTRFAGRAIGATLGGVVLQQGLDRSLPAIEAYQILFWFFAAAALLGLVVGWRLKE